jgi:two-component system, sensor histidine kinase YesM
MKHHRRHLKNSVHSYLTRVQLYGIAFVILSLAAYFVYSFRFVERQIIQANDTLLSVVNEGIARAAAETRALAFNIAYNPDVQRSLTETNTLDLIEYSNNYYLIAEMTVRSSDFIDDVALFTPDLTIFRNISSELTYSDYKYDLLDHLTKAPSRESRFVAIDRDSGSEYLSLVIPVFVQEVDTDVVSLIGYSMASFPVERVADLFRRISSIENSYIAIMDRDDTVIAFAANGPDSGLDPAELFRRPSRYLRNERTLLELETTLVSFIPKRDIYRRQFVVFAFSVLLVGILLSVFFLVGNRLNHAFSVPIDRLVGQLESIDGSNRQIRVAAMPNNEIGYIAGSINLMLDKIHDMTERSILAHKRMNDLELHSKDAELLALQSQINPHFLYNTLECIRSIGIDYHSPEVVQISTGLADILRYCLSTEFQVTLEREIAIVREYSQIIQLRFGDRYSFSIETDDEVREEMVIKMIIQPLVENAVFHGLERRRTGNLDISCSRSGDSIVVSIRDDGEGLSADHLRSLREQLTKHVEFSDVSNKRGIGLLNVHRRIQTFYGEIYGIEIDSGPEWGTTVTITLPMTRVHAVTEAII